jgi:hypothetical protein
MKDLSTLTIDQLVSLKNEIDGMIHNYKDGYLYICNVRSYGRNWEDKSIHNVHTLKELLYQYDGENGIVDVYSTNPDLSDVYNYGSLRYIESKEDYDKWKKLEYLKKIVPSIEDELDEWDNRDNLPFNKRPYFSPIYTREDLQNFKRSLEKYDMSFIPPRPYKKREDEMAEE